MLFSPYCYIYQRKWVSFFSPFVRTCPGNRLRLAQWHIKNLKSCRYNNIRRKDMLKRKKKTGKTFEFEILLPCYPVLGFLVPYFDRLVIRLPTPLKSSEPRTTWYLTPGQSWALPPRTKTTLCCWILWPLPGIYAVTTLPLLNLILAVFRSPEFGFFGFVIPVFKHTPFIWGRLTSAGDRRLRARCSTRHPRRTWL